MLKKFLISGLLVGLALGTFAEEAPAKPEPAEKKSVPEDQMSPNRVWGEDFSKIQVEDKEVGSKLPKYWKVEGNKPKVPPTVCVVVKDPQTNVSSLQVRCNKSTGGVVCDPYQMTQKIDLNKTPILRWRWRVLKYPNNADGRDAKRDDQPIAIYLGADGTFQKRSIAYRWEGVTPVGFHGSTSYAAGLLKVNYFVLRNQETPVGEWVTEERNVAEDFKKIYGKVPQEFAVSVMGNSQYTKSDSLAELDFIEFLPIK